ncbi:MAG: hypothetical protein QM756_20980 [Polyangiaceae bacterium]
MRLETHCAVAKHPGEPDGRVAFVAVADPFGMALLLNTPWLLRGEAMPALMARAAERALRERRRGAGSTGLRNVLECVDRALHPFSAPSFELEEARWDLGGHAGLLTLDDDGLRVARVGDVRVLVISRNTVHVALREHTLAAQFDAQGHRFTDPLPKNVITAALGIGSIPSDAVAERAIDVVDTVVLGTTNVLENVPATELVDAVRLDPASAADRILHAGWDASRAKDGQPLTGAVVVARRATSRSS